MCDSLNKCNINCVIHIINEICKIIKECASKISCSIQVIK